MAKMRFTSNRETSNGIKLKAATLSGQLKWKRLFYTSLVLNLIFISLLIFK